MQSLKTCIHHTNLAKISHMLNNLCYTNQRQDLFLTKMPLQAYLMVLEYLMYLIRGNCFLCVLALGGIPLKRILIKAKTQIRLTKLYIFKSSFVFIM